MDRTSSRIALLVAESMLGTPYHWGGDDSAGADCSGFVCEALRASGHLGSRERLSSAGLYSRFHKARNTVSPSEAIPGDLVFWAREGRVNHVAMLHTSGFVIEAGGGDADTNTLEEAIAENAFVRIRPLRYRGAPFAILRLP